jgi:hypothetical protein
VLQEPADSDPQMLTGRPRRPEVKFTSDPPILLAWRAAEDLVLSVIIARHGRSDCPTSVARRRASPCGFPTLTRLLTQG